MATCALMMKTGETVPCTEGLMETHQPVVYVAVAKSSTARRMVKGSNCQQLFFLLAGQRQLKRMLRCASTTCAFV